MKRGIFTAAIVGLLSITTSSIAQDKRGDTDYTNNRSGNKKNTEQQVNTKQETPTKFIEYLPGVWTVEQVLRGNEDITGTDTLTRDERIEFNREGRFVRHAGNEQVDSGAYRLSEQHALLYLESEGREEKNSEYNIWFDSDGKMVLQPRNTNNHAEQFKFVYRRSGTVSSSNRN